MVSIAGLDKATVIQALYANSRPIGMVFIHAKDGPLDRSEAESLLGKDIDYLHGRVMKVLIDGDSFEERLYDRDNGAGAAARIVEKIRNVK